MNLRVLRPADGKMMKLVKYKLEGGATEEDSDTVDLIHNHELDDNAGENNKTVTEKDVTGSEG